MSLRPWQPAPIRAYAIWHPICILADIVEVAFCQICPWDPSCPIKVEIPSSHLLSFLSCIGCALMGWDKWGCMRPRWVNITTYLWLTPTWETLSYSQICILVYCLHHACLKINMAQNVKLGNFSELFSGFCQPVKFSFRTDISQNSLVGAPDQWTCTVSRPFAFRMYNLSAIIRKHNF